MGVRTWGVGVLLCASLSVGVETQQTLVPMTEFDRYEQRQWDATLMSQMTRAAFNNMAADLRANAARWIPAGGPADAGRRRLLVATYTLDLLATQHDTRMWDRGWPSAELFDWASSLIRRGPQSDAERLWQLAAVGLLQRFGAPGFAYHVRLALERYPDEPRLLLARALVEDLQVWPQKRNELPFTVEPTRMYQLQSRYTDAAAVPAVAAEALIRLGFIELQRGRTREAQARFDAAGDPGDTFLRYLRHLFRGQAFQAAGQLAEAEAAYRAAYDTVPLAQSATLALAATLTTMRRETEAVDLVNRMLEVSNAPVDPWTFYVTSEWRFWDIWMDVLRSAVRR